MAAPSSPVSGGEVFFVAKATLTKVCAGVRAAAAGAALSSVHSTASPQRESVQQTGVQGDMQLLEAVSPHPPQAHGTYDTSYLGGVKAHCLK